MKLFIKSGLLLFIVFGIYFFADQAIADDTSQVRNNIGCDKKDSSGACNWNVYVGSTTNVNGTNVFQAYRGTFSGHLEGHGGFGPSGGKGGLATCLSPNGAIWTGQCWIMVDAQDDVNGNGVTYNNCGPSSCPGDINDRNANYNGGGDYTNGCSTCAYEVNFKYWVGEFYANDATWSGGRAEVFGRLVEAEIDDYPSSMNVNQTSQISWDLDYYDSNTIDLSTNGPINCTETSQTTANCTATGVGTALVTIRAEGPTGNGKRPVSHTVEIDITGTVTPSPPSPFAPSCNPGTQTISVDNVAPMSASGGNGSYSWSVSPSINVNPPTGNENTFDPLFESAGTYTVTVVSGGYNDTCEVIVNAPPPSPGTVRVTSNIGTTWTINGGCPGICSGTFQEYTNRPPGSYTIGNITTQVGYNYTVSPALTQSLTGGNSITFNIQYTPVSVGSCDDDALLNFVTGLPPTLVAGQPYNFIVGAENIGDTYWYHGSLFRVAYEPTSTVPSSNVNPLDSHSGTSLGYGESSWTLTAPTIPGNYTLRLRMKHIVVDAGSAWDHSKSPLDAQCGSSYPVPSEHWFGNTLTANFEVSDNGTLQVNCASPAGATWTITPGGNTGASPSSTHSLDPATYTVTYGAVPGYTTSPPNTNVVITTGNTTTVNCNYTLVPFPPPDNIIVDNSVCGNLTIRWTDNSTNENYFQVWASLTSGGPYTLMTGNLYGPNGIAGTGGTGTWTDSPTPNNRYYYVVRVYRNSPLAEAQSVEGTAFNRLCIPDLTSSSKGIYEVDSNPYTVNTVIQDGDEVTFEVVIRNTGTGNATILHICDTPSSNLAMSGGLQVIGGGSASIDNTPDYCSSGVEIDISGMSIAPSGTRTIRFDTDFTSGSTAFEICSNSAMIHYTDVEGNKTRTASFVRLCNRSGSAAPDFNEVAP